MLDLRVPIGWFFLINASVLICTGLASPVATMIGDTAINLNLSWGVVMALFGALMLGLTKLDPIDK